MIAYRAETALVTLLRRHLNKEEDARALIRELFVSSADIEPDDQAKTLTIRIHRMACPAHDRAIASLLDELNPFPPPRNRRQDDLLPGLNSEKVQPPLTAGSVNLSLDSGVVAALAAYKSGVLLAGAAELLPL